MKNELKASEVSSQIALPSGAAIVLLDRLGKGGQYSKEELARNVYRVNADGHIVWQISSQFDAEGNPYTRLHHDGDTIVAYRWDGGSYLIDVDTGIATPLTLER